MGTSRSLLISPLTRRTDRSLRRRKTQNILLIAFAARQAGFYGMIENIDENMGRLMGKLEEWDLFKDTILIFMSDNGMTGGGSSRVGQEVAKGYPFYNAGMKGLKGSTDEGGVRVPFLVRWDGQWKSGVTSPQSART